MMNLVVALEKRESSVMNAFFTELGRTIYRRWQQDNFSLSTFPHIARGALVSQPPSEHVHLHELIGEFLLSDEQPFQSASGFGQPELIVYDTPKFYIQLLFWLDGTTDIHQHEFSGAFHVMAGSSIHSEFTFEDVQPITSHFRIGNLCLKKAQLLHTGSTVSIRSGRDGIHSLFHLETPSVTVVVRTHSDPGTGPQFTYLPPHLAIDPMQGDSLTCRRKQLLDMLESTEDPSYGSLVLEMISALDFERGFFVLQNCVAHLRHLGMWEDVWEAFAAKHGAFAAFVMPTLEQIMRRDGLTALRGSIEEVEHRFFLALLLNLEKRDDVLKMVAEQFPGDALKTILRWAEELIQLRESGIYILDAVIPWEIGVSGGIEDLEMENGSELFIKALGYFIMGGKIPKELKKLGPESLSLLRNAFLKSGWGVLMLH